MSRAVQFFAAQQCPAPHEYAVAEAWASDSGYSFSWQHDDVDSSHHSDDERSYPWWTCTMRDDAGNVVASLGCIDFGPDCEPWGDPYRRQVEAEIAMGVMPVQYHRHLT